MDAIWIHAVVIRTAEFLQGAPIIPKRDIFALSDFDNGLVELVYFILQASVLVEAGREGA